MLLSLVATAEKVSSETRRVRSYNSQRRLNQPIELTPLTSELAKLEYLICKLLLGIFNSYFLLLPSFYVKNAILFCRFNKIIVFLQNQLNNKRL